MGHEGRLNKAYKFSERVQTVFELFVSLLVLGGETKVVNVLPS